MQEMSKISIIVPIYKEDNYLDECIESIIKQTYKNLEIILVDDGSPDKCPEICDKWAKRDKRIVVIHKVNGGLVSARQAGMERSTGQYIGYVDGDDWIEPDYYANMIESALETNADIVISGFKKELFGKTIEYINKIEKGIYRKNELAEKIFATMICQGNNYISGLYTYLWNKLFKREIVYSHQQNVDRRIIIGEDSACVYPAILRTKSIVITEDTGYHYRQRMDSLLRKAETKRDSINKLNIFYLYLKKVFSLNNYAAILLPQLDNFYLYHLIMMSDCLVQEYPELGENFPFCDIKKESDVIIFSAGAYGIHVYHQFCRSKDYNVVAWVDSDYRQYINSEYLVLSPEECTKLKFDYILVASVDGNFVEESVRVLLELGILYDKIKTVDQNIKMIEAKLREQGVMS